MRENVLNLSPPSSLLVDLNSIYACVVNKKVIHTHNGKHVDVDLHFLSLNNYQRRFSLNLFLCSSGSRKSHADLTKDEWNHGTMVAGIISLNGPDNVKILNLKVLHC